MDYIKRAVELSKESFDAGEFPAGAILVSKSGKVYESKPSLAHRHGEMSAIDAAIESEGAPLTGAVLYTSMQPCLMCSSKMYWAGVEVVHYVIPKSKTHAHYAYENGEDTAVVASKFWKPIKMVHDPELLEKALSHYTAWVKKIEGV